MPYDEIKAEAVVRYFEEYLVYIDGPLAGQPIRLRDWQADPLREIFGTGIALYMLTIAGEMGATVYCTANSRDQATQVLKPCADMVRLSPKLQRLDLIQAQASRPSPLRRICSPSDDRSTGHGLRPVPVVNCT